MKSKLNVVGDLVMVVVIPALGFTSLSNRGVDVEVAHRDCEGQGPIGTILASSFPGGCKAIVSKGSGNGCLTADAGGVSTNTICCCDGDR